MMKLTPFRIVLIYLLVLLGWVIVWDPAAEQIAYNPTGTAVQWLGFAAGTAGLLYWLITSYEASEKHTPCREKNLVEALPVMIITYRPGLTGFSVNREFEKVTGWTREQASSADILAKLYPDEQYRKRVIQFLQEPDSRWQDFEMVTRTGARVQATWTNIRLTDNTRIALGIDISRRKQIEEELRNKEEWLQLTTTSSNIGLWEWHPKTGKVVIDDVWANLVGYTLDELKPVSIETWNRLLHPDDLIRFEKEIENYFSGKTPIYECEVRMKHKEGHWVWILDRGRAIEWDRHGKPVRLVGTHVDITYRKQIEERIEAEKQRFKVTSSLVSDVLYDYDVKNDKTWWNDGIRTVFGYPDEVVENNNMIWTENIHPDDKESVLKSFNRALTPENPAELWEEEYRFLSHDGQEHFIRDNAFIYRNDQNEAVRLLGTMVDLTEERRTSQFLEYHANLLREISDAVISTDEKSVIKSWNRAAEKIYGWTREEVIGKPFNDLIETHFVGTTEEEVLEEFRKHGQWDGEIRQTTKNGSIRNILSSIRIVKNSKGEFIDAVAVNRDITDRKQVEKENRLLADLFIHSNTGLAVSNHHTNKLERVNRAYADLYGYDVEDMAGMDVTRLYAQSALPDLDKAVSDLTRDGYTTYESVLRRKDNTTFPALINLSLVKGKYSDTQYRISTVQDISTLKEQQYELQKSRDRLMQAQQLARLGYWTLELDSLRFWWSGVMYSIYQKEEETYHPSLKEYLALCHPEDRFKVKRAIVQYADVPHFELTHRIIRKDGRTGYVQVRGERVFDHILNKEIVRGAVLDVTEIKQIEEQLEEEQLRFEIAANITSDVIWESNPSAQKLWWGEGMETVLGFKKEEYESNPDFWAEHIAPEDRQRVLSSMNNAKKSGAATWTEEYAFFDAEGNKRTIVDSAVMMRNNHGEIIRIIGAMVDKTKETEYERALRKQSYKFEMIANSSNDVLYDWDIETGEVWWSDGWQSRFHFSEDEIEPTLEWWAQKIHPDDRQKIDDIISEAPDTDKKYRVVYYRLLNGKGEYSVVVDKGYFLKNGEGRNECMVGAISDITTDVKAKRELEASEEQYRLLFELSPMPMFIYNRETLCFVSANKSAVNKYGYSVKELQDMQIFDLHPEEEQAAIKESIRQTLQKERSEFEIWTHLTSRGERMVVEISGTNITYDGKTQRLAIVNDITRQKKAEERAISAVVEGEERERQRIAKELHDGLGQYLSAANMNLKSVFEDLGEMPEELSKAFGTGLQFLNHAISETRNISQNLLPKAIQDYGLELAAESLINHLQKNNEINFYFYKQLDGIVLPDKVQINLYRILQESLNNAIRHGNPEKIDVQLVHSDGEILMTVEDNGCGFDIHQQNSDGIGIRSIKTRVGAMSANLDIASNPGKGTVVSVVVPL